MSSVAAIGRLAPYRALLSARYRMMLQYRAAAIAGVGTQFFWGFIRLMILAAFYRSTTETQPMELAEVVSYVWLGQAFLGLLPSMNHDLEIDELIRSGGVCYELLRPVDLYTWWYVRIVASRVASTSLRSLPILVLAMGVLPLIGLPGWALSPPDSGAALAAFAVSMFGAVLLGAALLMLVHVSMLWTISGEGLSRVMPTVVIIFSGSVVPLPLFPDWAQPLLDALPFRGLVDVPFRVYSGSIPVSEAFVPIALAFVWALALVLLGRFLLARGLRALVVQGG